jgi:hypothetical protein
VIVRSGASRRNPAVSTLRLTGVHQHDRRAPRDRTRNDLPAHTPRNLSLTSTNDFAGAVNCRTSPLSSVSIVRNQPANFRIRKHVNFPASRSCPSPSFDVNQQPVMRVAIIRLSAESPIMSKEYACATGARSFRKRQLTLASPGQQLVMPAMRMGGVVLGRADLGLRQPWRDMSHWSAGGVVLPMAPRIFRSRCMRSCAVK